MQPGEIRARISKTAEMSQGEDVSLDLIADKVSQYTVELAGEGSACTTVDYFCVDCYGLDSTVAQDVLVV